MRKFNCEQTQKIVEETNSTRSANKFLANGTSSIIAMKMPDGSVANNKNEILALTTEVYRNLYDSKTEIEPDVLETSQAVEDVMEAGVKHAIVLKPENRQTDGIVNELIKYAAYTLDRPLALLLTQCIKQRQIPSARKNARAILIYKKGDPTEVKNN